MSLLGFDALGRLALGQLPTASSQTLVPQTQWYLPRKAGLTAAVIATTFVGFVAPPQAQASPAFTQFSQPLAKPNLAFQAAWKFNPTPPQAQTAIFAQFSQPQFNRTNLPDEQPSALFEVLPPPAISIAFTQFSQPSFGKSPLPDEQPSTLFEVLPPQAPPFSGFARFSDYLPKRSVTYLYSAFQPSGTLVPVIDTHDGVWVKKKRKKPERDPLDIELEERAKRRAAIELAVYGPEVVYEPPPATLFAPQAEPAPNVEDLARAIMAAKQMQEQQQRAAIEQDDEDVLEMILRDLA